jgi:hypothetical protein
MNRVSDGIWMEDKMVVVDGKPDTEWHKAGYLYN